MAKIITYRTLDEKEEITNKLAKYTSSSTITISKKWFPVGYSHTRTIGTAKTLEGHLQSQCLRWLRDEHYLHVRCETGLGIARTGADTIVARGSMMAGWPDILIVLPGGRLAGCELKIAGGHLSTQQLGILSDINHVGGLGFVTCSLDGLKNALCGIPPVRTIDRIGDLVLSAPVGIY